MDSNLRMPLWDTLEQAENPSLEYSVSRMPLKHEILTLWALREWERRFPSQPCIPVWAEDTCANNLALQRVKAGRRLKGKGRYAGFQMIACPYSVPISRFYVPARKAVLTDNVGAFIFTFEHEAGNFNALFVSAHEAGRCGVESISIALVPPDRLNIWSDFETQCRHAAYRLERSEKVYIIGGAEDSFEPNVEWDNVILPDALKADLRGDMETFFDRGVDVYKQLNLPAFRKLLLVGPPGTGKSTLCAALARLALDRKCIVVYVSSAQKDSDGEGATFDKIQHALRIVSNSPYPALLVIEEFDVYLKPKDKSQILNVLDGFECPNNPRGALMIATTNYPEAIDERIAKRPGRIDRIVYIPEIQDEDMAVRMLMHYMGTQWQEDHRAVAGNLIGQTGAFVREAALYARMLTLNKSESDVSVELLKQSISTLSNQLATGSDLVRHRRIGFHSRGLKKPQPDFSTNQRQD